MFKLGKRGKVYVGLAMVVVGLRFFFRALDRASA
jgi:hypothetical protein